MTKCTTLIGMPPELDPQRYLVVLAELTTIRASVKQLEYVTVDLVRATGATWETVGEAMGMSRQAAARKYGQPRNRLI